MEEVVLSTHPYGDVVINFISYSPVSLKVCVGLVDVLIAEPSPKSQEYVPASELFVKFTISGGDPKSGSGVKSVMGNESTSAFCVIESLQPKLVLTTSFTEYVPGVEVRNV